MTDKGKKPLEASGGWITINKKEKNPKKGITPQIPLSSIPKPKQGLRKDKREKFPETQEIFSYYCT